MRYPNLYRGIRQLFFAELLVSVFTSIIIFFPQGFPTEDGSQTFENASTWVLLLLGAVATVTRVLALGQARLNEDTFKPAQIYALISFGIFAHNLIVLPLFLEWLNKFLEDPGVLNKDLLIVGVACLPIVLQAAALLFSLSVSVTVIKVVDTVSVRLKDLVVHELGAQLDLPLSLLFCASCLLAIIKAAFPEEIVSGAVFKFSTGFLLLGCILFAMIRFLIYLKQVELMLSHAKVRQKRVWFGVARELLPDEPAPEDLVDLVVPDPVVLVRPEDPAAPSKWANDKERFFPDPILEESPEPEEKDLRFPKSLQSLEKLFPVEILCVLCFVFSLVLSRHVRFYPFREVFRTLLFSASVPPWFTSLAGKVACYLQWKSLRHASAEEQDFARGEKILVRALWISFGIFLIPFFLYGLSLEPFDFKSLYAFEPFAYLLRVVWVITPVQVTLTVVSGLCSLANRMRDPALAEHLHALRLRMKLVLYPLTAFYFLCVILESANPEAELFQSLFVKVAFGGGLAAIIWFWYVFLLAMQQINKKLRLEKVDEQKCYSDAPIVTAE